jgi:hypothetical protein
LVQKIKKRLLSTSIFLNQAGRLEMVNAVLSALPTFFMGNMKLPPSVYKQIDKLRKHCMWRGSDLNARKPPLAAWKLATRPKENGGMGIINLATQNDAIVLKNLHKFFNKLDVPWVQLIWNNYYRNGTAPNSRPKGSFWWRGLLNILTQFKGISSVQVENGTSTSLWFDMWSSKIRNVQYPELFSYAMRSSICQGRRRPRRQGLDYVVRSLGW